MAYVLQANYAFFPMVGAVGELAWNSSNDFILIAAPMFIMMGELMHRSGMSERLFSALSPWFARIPGRLIHTNIAASAIFAATSGSSVATAATIGTVAIPNMDKGGYNRPLFLGSIAAGGTLGILIPPSINMIIYAVLTDTSVADLYAAGFIPGFMLAGLFSLMILGLALLRPAWAGPKVDTTRLWAERVGGPAPSHPAARALPGRRRLDLCRRRDADRSRGARPDGDAVPRRGQWAVDPAGAAARLRGHGADDLHGDADRHRRLLPELRDGLDRPGQGDHRSRPGPRLAAAGHARRRS